MRICTGLTCFFSLAMFAFAADHPRQFPGRVIDPEIGKVCYAVTLADVNGDKKPDIVAVSENRVLWYEAPKWTPHVIIDKQTPTDNVCIAPLDIDGDGKVDFALGAGWTSKGTIHWLSRGKSLDDKWQVHSIGEERWLHRMRFADVLGTGRPQLVISPLNASVGNGIRLTAFEIPAKPKTDRWKPTVLNADLNRMHNHWHLDFDKNGVVDTITASREGVYLIRRIKGEWTKQKLGSGIKGNDPNSSGAGEVKVGRGRDGEKYIATIEPMHGHSLAVYRWSKSTNGGTWNRSVIDSGFRRGHALWTSDLDGDGADEIVFGHSDTPKKHGVNVYWPSAKPGGDWTKQVVDEGGVATEDLIVGDVTGDGQPDIVAGGRATHNVKLYVNTKPAKDGGR